MARSVKVHPDRIPQVKQSLERARFLTQEQLSIHLELALSTVNNFLNGKNVSISTFDQICDALDLDRDRLIFVDEDIASSEVSPMDSNLDQTVRQQGSGKNINVRSGKNFFIGSSENTSRNSDGKIESLSEPLPTEVKQDVSQYGDGQNINIGTGENVHIG